MIDSDYLRRQAETCVLLSRSTFDLTVAGRLRALAAELRAKAAQLDHQGFPAHIVEPNGSPQSDRDRG